MKKIKSAWVVYQTGTSVNKIVISILSSRYTPEEVIEKIEYLYALLHYDLVEHLDYFGRYNCKNPPYKAERSSYTLNSENYAIWHSLIYCGHNPFLVAELASDIELSENGKDLKWMEPNRIKIDMNTGCKSILCYGKRTEAPFSNMRLASSF